MSDEEIGAFEAKTKLPEILRKTADGRSYLITRRGKPVARLVPVEAPMERRLLTLLFELNAVREGVTGEQTIRELIEEGRRF